VVGMIALIPARKGSRRIRDKNIRHFFGKPLMNWTIETAIRSKLFNRIIVLSDSREYLDVASEFGVETFLRRESNEYQPDIEWKKECFHLISGQDYMILRPTNPFRSVAMLEEGVNLFNSAPEVLHVRGMTKITEHPMKMWRFKSGYAEPYCAKDREYMNPTQTFEPLLVQNGSIEIWRTSPLTGKILPFITNGYEGFDINTEDDWTFAEYLVDTGRVALQ